MTQSVTAERRAIESLRSGVPSAAVVSALGSEQVEIEDRFVQLLDRVSEREPGGMLIGGGFGAGKSHLLRHLGLLAHQAGFAVSHLVVSKETSFHDPVKVAWAALENAVLPAAKGPAIEHIAATIDVEGPRYAELLRWAASRSSGLDERFPASLLLYARLRDQGDEFCHALVQFWSGEPLSTPDLRRRLREFKENFTIGRVRPTTLARQRLRFAARLMSAGGCAGWVILFDEVELIARYPLLARAKAYAEVSRWVTGDHGGRDVPIGAVLALTDDFPAVMIDGNKDREKLPAGVRRRGTAEAEELARQAEAGMAIIEREMQLLSPPDDTELSRAYRRLKELHGTAFDWQPPDVAGLPRTGANRMRQYVRAWINEWDLLRLDPSIPPQTRIERLAPGPS